MSIVTNSKLLIMREKKLANDPEEQQTSGEDTVENEGSGEMLLISCPIYSNDSQTGAQCVVKKVKDVPKKLPFLTTDPIPAKAKLPDNNVKPPVRPKKYPDTDRLADYKRLKTMKLKRMKESIPDLNREISRTYKPETRRKMQDMVYAYVLVVINNARLLITEQFIREDQDVVLVINRKGGGTRRLGRKAKRLWLKEGKLKRFRGKKRKIRMRSLSNMPSFYLRPKKEQPASSIVVGGGPVNTDVVVNLELPEPEVGSCVQPPHVIVHQDPAQILVMQPPPEPPPAIVEQVPVPVPIVYPPTKCDCDPGIPEYPDPMPPYCTDSNEHLRHSTYADRKVLPQFIC